ncbi:MAG: hypothetical protein IJI14_06130, partial [Anaerolineaceae bacterium]|nr:hypothetical protein [Anaerolineaceae bacterium]
ALICLGLDLLNSFVVIKLEEQNAIVSRVMSTSTGELNSSVLNGMNMISNLHFTMQSENFYRKSTMKAFCSYG